MATTEGLTVAEIELDRKDEPFERPPGLDARWPENVSITRCSQTSLPTNGMLAKSNNRLTQWSWRNFGLFASPSSFFLCPCRRGMWMLPLLQQQNCHRCRLSDCASRPPISITLTALRWKMPWCISVRDVPARSSHPKVSSSPTTIAVTAPSSLIAPLSMDYLTSGFWAASRQQELANPGLTVTLVKAIDDVTDYVKAALQRDEDSTAVLFLPAVISTVLPYRESGPGNAYQPSGMGVEIRPFFGGNRYYNTTLTYRDVRLVGAPPSAISSAVKPTAGAGRVRPATSRFSASMLMHRAILPTMPSNVPLHPERWFPISLNGISETISSHDDRLPRSYQPLFHSLGSGWNAMWTMPSSSLCVNCVRIPCSKRCITIPLCRIQYASKYASSANGYKRAKGSNRAIDTYHLIDLKNQEKDRLRWDGNSQGKPEYAEAVTLIEQIVSDRHDLALRRSLLQRLSLTAWSSLRSHAARPAARHSGSRG